VKKKKTAFPGKSAIGHDGLSDQTGFVNYNFDVVDVNEKPTNIQLVDLANKLTKKGEQFIANITLSDPDFDDEIIATIPSNSPNATKFSIKNQKLYFDNKSNKANVPYQVIIRATDWEGLSLEKQFEVLVDDSGNVSVEAQSSSSGLYYDERFMDTDGDGFVDADEILMGTDRYDFRSYPSDFDGDGILDFYDGDYDNDGYLNENDQFPFNASEWIDADGDGIPDNLDNDDDNDGTPDLSVNWLENYLIQDLFPNDPNESSDFDRDGVGDNADLDDDNDGFEDSIDEFPFNPLEWLDTDGDLIGDNLDPDSDNDGYSNLDETLLGTDPLNPNDFPEDLDNDFVPDSIDSDIDGDEIPNNFDNAPRFFNPDQEYVEGDSNYISLEFADFFSPNGDGINDFWTIKELERYPNNKVWIYDANGNLVFEDVNYKNDWDGKLNGVPLPQASYLFLIDNNSDGNINHEGWFYLTR